MEEKQNLGAICVKRIQSGGLKAGAHKGDICERAVSFYVATKLLFMCNFDTS